MKMTEEEVKNIKNHINQIEDNDVILSDEFPDKKNFSKNKYIKTWVSCIFIDICGYTKICKEQEEGEEYIGKMVRTFHQGILKIFNYYKIVNIQIQGDGIFGVVHSPTQNHENSISLFECAKEINGYLNLFWKYANYKISISSWKELMIVVENKQEDTREIVYAGGAVNIAKKNLDDMEEENLIVLNDSFISRNNKILKKENNLKQKGNTWLCWKQYNHWE